MKKILPLMLILVLSLSAATKVEKVIKNFQKKYKKVQALKVDFKQVNYFKLTNTKSEIFGTLWLMGEDKFRLETEDQVIVSDGKTFWRYNKLENQVLIDYAKKSQQDIFLNNFLYKINDLYYTQIVKEEKIKGKKYYVVKLVPKVPEENFFQSIKVWIADKSWDIYRVVYLDYNDNESEYLVEDIQMNPPGIEKKFHFTPPEGVEVVDLRL